MFASCQIKFSTFFGRKKSVEPKKKHLIYGRNIYIFTEYVFVVIISYINTDLRTKSNNYFKKNF